MRAVRSGGQLWAGVLVAAIGVVVAVAGFTVRQVAALSDPIGPGAFPGAVGCVLVVLGLAAAIIAALGRNAEPTDIGQPAAVGVMVAALVLYLVLLQPAGFLLTTMAFLVVLFAYLGERRWWVLVLVAVLFTVAVFVAFRYGLNVALPKGVVGL